VEGFYRASTCIWSRICIRFFLFFFSQICFFKKKKKSVASVDLDLSRGEKSVLRSFRRSLGFARSGSWADWADRGMLWFCICDAAAAIGQGLDLCVFFYYFFRLLLTTNKQTLSGALLDFSRPMATLYGAARGLAALGAAATRSLLVPQLSLLMPFVQTAQSEGPPARRAEVGRLHAALVDACVALVKVFTFFLLFCQMLRGCQAEQEEAGGARDGRKRERADEASQIALFRDFFGSAFDKAAKQAGVDLK
jgi:hypothetical protein